MDLAGFPMTNTISVEQERWDAARKGDPVFDFVDAVNARAVRDPLWNSNYALAHYHAFVDEAQSHMVAKLGLTE